MVCLCELSRPIVGFSAVGSGIDLRLLGLYGKGTCCSAILPALVYCLLASVYMELCLLNILANILIQHHKMMMIPFSFPSQEGE